MDENRENTQTKALLEEIYKGANMGKHSLDTMMHKPVKDKLEKHLKTQYAEYEKVAEKAAEMMKNYEKEPKDINFFSKAVLWSGIQMNTLFDDSQRKIAEILLQGTNMGITATKEWLKDYRHATEDALALAEEFLQVQENNVEKLHRYL